METTRGTARLLLLSRLQQQGRHVDDLDALVARVRPLVDALAGAGGPPLPAGPWDDAAQMGLAAEVVADIGAGTGYFSRRIARKVAPSGSVLAVEIQQEMLDLLMKRMGEAKVTNVKPVLGTIMDPKLPAGGVDTVLMVDVYHEFDHPFEMMENISKALKPGGRVVFVEYRGEDPNVPIKRLHKMTELQVVKEMTAHPLEWAETLGVLPRQHIIVFRKKG